MNTYQVIKINSFWMYLAKISISIGNFLVAILLVKIFSVGEFALYGTIVASISLINLATYFGISNGYQRYFPELVKAGENEVAYTLYCYGIFVRILSLAFVILGLWIIRDFWKNALEITVSETAFISSLLLIIGKSLVVNSDAALGALLMQKAKCVIGVVFSVLRVATVLMLAFLNFDFTSYVLALGVIETTSFVISTYYVVVRLGGLRKFVLPKSYAVRFFNYSKYSYLSQLEQMFMDSNVSILLVGCFLDVNSVAYIIFALTFSASLFSIVPISSLQEVLVPVLITKLNKDKKDNFFVGQVVQQYRNVLSFVYFPVFLLSFLFLDELISILGKTEYLNAKWYLLLAIFFRCMSVVGLSAKLGLILLERSKELFLASLAFVIYLPLLLLLIPSFEVYGAITSWGGAVLLTYTLRDYYLTKITAINMLENRSIINLGMCTFVVLIALVSNNYFGKTIVFFNKILMFISYLIIAYKYCVVKELQILVSLLFKEILEASGMRLYKS